MEPHWWPVVSTTQPHTPTPANQIKIKTTQNMATSHTERHSVEAIKIDKSKRVIAIIIIIMKPLKQRNERKNWQIK